MIRREKALETIVVLALASLIASLWFEVSWLAYVAIGFLAVGVLSIRLSLLIGRGWLAFSHYLGLIMNYLIMFINFYLFLVPLSFFQRLTGSNQLLKKTGPDSHFHRRDHLFTQKDIEYPW